MPFRDLFKWFSLPETREVKLQKLIRLIDATVEVIERVESNEQLKLTHTRDLQLLRFDVQKTLVNKKGFAHPAGDHHRTYVNRQEAIVSDYQSGSKHVQEFLADFNQIWGHGNEQSSGSGDIDAVVRESAEGAVFEVYQVLQASEMGPHSEQHDESQVQEIIDRRIPPSPQAQDSFSGSTGIQEISRKHRLLLDRPQDQAGTSNSNSLGGRFSAESARDSDDSSHVSESKGSARCTIGSVQYDEPGRRSTPDFIYNTQRPASLEWLEEARAYLNQTATPEGDNSASASASAQDSV